MVHLIGPGFVVYFFFWFVGFVGLVLWWKSRDCVCLFVFVCFFVVKTGFCVVVKSVSE